MEPNVQQKRIIQAARTGRNVAVVAGAGTGKTSTSQQIVEAMPYRSFHYLAYNASTKEEGKKRFPRSCRVTTSHGLAYGTLGKRFDHRNPQSGGRRIMNSEAARRWGLGPQRFAWCLQCECDASYGDHEGHPVTVEQFEGWRAAMILKRTIERFCYSDSDFVLPWHTPRIQGVDERVMPLIREWAQPIAQEMWDKDLTSEDGKLWYWPDIYLKMYQLQEPRIWARTIILDEAQDTNDCVWDILMRQENKQLIVVGDSAQMIYEWRNSKDVMGLVPHAVRLFLDGSYRFGPMVAEEANKWLELIGTDLRLKGYKRLNSIVTDEPQDEDPDCVICRTNGGVIAGAIQGLEQGRQVAVVGGGHAIKSLAEAAERLMRGEKTDHPDLVGFESWEQVRQFCKDEPEDAGTLIPLAKAVDEHGVPAILDMTGRLVPEDRASLTITTAHKAKGREWNHIRIGSDFPDLLGRARPNKEELRLAYVTITRGRQVVERGSLAQVDEMRVAA